MFNFTLIIIYHHYIHTFTPLITINASTFIKKNRVKHKSILV